MEIQELLQKIGLTEREASVYLAVLELGSATGYSIARKSNTKRPTAYMVLETLEQKRLIHRAVHSGKTLFTAESPEILLRDINKKAELTKRGLPQLLALFNAKKEKPQVEMFQGRDGIKEAIDKVIRAGSVRLYGTSGQGLTLYPEAVKDFTKAVAARQLTVKDILADPIAEVKYIKMFKDQPNYEIRLMKPGTKIQNDFALFGDTILMFQYRPEMFAVMITSKDMANMFTSLYDLAWDAAKPA
jgi:sugar-specific transcriptional regulator TrmB